MIDTSEFDRLAEEYRSVRVRLDKLRPEVQTATVALYNKGVTIRYLTEQLNASVPTVYSWVRQDPATPKRKAGRPRKLPLVDALPPALPPTQPAPLVAAHQVDTGGYDFGWFEDRVRVDCGNRRVLIDTDRLVFEGDRELGQLLVSGTDLELTRKFNSFVNGA